DKFLQPGNKAIFRKLFNPIVSAIATRIDVVFEEVLAQCSELSIKQDMPMAFNGWFRNIELIKQ
ncbi:MAG: phosphatidylethanolamine N-methyltransferase, partial [Gammaproteobacteria bacterium]|nr:phosphatidylethanolamine N-methyltransferase [Gammaproteobacteria bacterium]